jgi:HD-like signal output (HDOD) protein
MAVEATAIQNPALIPQDIICDLKHLRSAPKVLPKLKLLLKDGNSELPQIVKLMRLDPGLATRVLQVANSPYFFTGSRCLTVEEAVSRVGYDEVYELLSYAVSAQMLNRPVIAYRMEADQMWVRSVCCALAAETLAKRVGVDQSAAYTLGLLHGVGMIAIDEWAQRNGRELRMSIYPFPSEATKSERAQLGFTQADVGAVLLETWDFPVEISDPVRYQYAPAASKWCSLAALLVAARWIRSAVLAREGGELPPLPSAAQVRPAGIPVAALTDSLPFVAQQLTAAITVLEEPAPVPAEG